MHSLLALDALWHTLTTPTNIIRLLPEEVCRLVSPSPGQARQFILERPLIESDFAIFDKYAPRVRVVQFQANGITVGCEIFSALKAHRNPIFPRLLELVWHPSTNSNFLAANADFLGAFHLVSRGVPKNRLSLTMWGALDISSIARARLDPRVGTDLCEVVACLNRPLVTWIPDVSSLELFTGSYLALPNLLEGLQTLTQLRNLRVQFSVGPAILLHLAGLPHLLSLHLWKETTQTIQTLGSLVDQQRLATGFRSFSALESLSLNTLRTCSSFDLDILFPLITSDALHTCTFGVDNRHPIDFAFVALIAAPHRATQLRHIEILATELHPSQADVSADVLEPLYTCANLESFDFMGTLHIKEAHFARMTASWPRLRALRLINTQSPAPAPGLHVYALRRLLQPCPAIYKLTMSVDARVTGEFACDAPEGRDLRPLYSTGDIMFLASPCEMADTAPVAAFLEQTFPRLANFGGTVQSGGPSEADRPWQIVKDRLPEVDTWYRMMMAQLLKDEEDNVVGSFTEGGRDKTTENTCRFNIGPKNLP
ncbi:hypothetical protein B0H13DRAFT_2406468 [Mycena leptocephala]|nr:hypothetical protein B0H13DRAFT_2406468 [Mycena leptocephala]